MIFMRIVAVVMSERVWNFPCGTRIPLHLLSRLTLLAYISDNAYHTIPSSSPHILGLRDCDCPSNPKVLLSDLMTPFQFTSFPPPLNEASPFTARLPPLNQISEKNSRYRHVEEVL